MMLVTDKKRTQPAGYAGALLRVDLTTGRLWEQTFDDEFARTYVGGTGMGARILYDEVGADVQWNDPENRLIMATGPLAGTPTWGSGGLSVVTKGAITGGGTSTQANGFFGANIKSSGFDGIVFEGRSEEWVYLFIQNGTAELRDATHLLGLDTWETQDHLYEELGMSGHQLSVYSIGPSGENLIRFAGIQGDYGHVASKNGCGAVMGSKRVKAVAIARGNRGIFVADPRGVFRTADDIAYQMRSELPGQNFYTIGTLGGVTGLAPVGGLPIKNLTTNILPPEADMSKWEPLELREGFDHRGHQCNACGMHHCHMQVIREGAHKGEVVDEPEYEGWVGAGWVWGCTDRTKVSWMNTQCDRAGVDVNEFGWVIAWVMECYEKEYITREQLGGIQAVWGDADAAYELLQMLCTRQGFGDLLAEGVKRASEQYGGPAADCAVYTMKGAQPRGHDHRALWAEMLDTCTSSTGTFETGTVPRSDEFGVPPLTEPQNPEQVPKFVAGMLGRMDFEDSIGTCKFTTGTTLASLAEALNAVTGWKYTKDDAMYLGRRTAALLRAFNLRCGIGPELEKPSVRYGSTPIDGPAAGVSTAPHWDHMLDRWYQLVEYDRDSGRPWPHLLDRLGLPDVKAELWG
jgi:aldehyde:ferredoxin oxidoreductase